MQDPYIKGLTKPSQVGPCKADGIYTHDDRESVDLIPLSPNTMSSDDETSHSPPAHTKQLIDLVDTLSTSTKYHGDQGSFYPVDMLTKTNEVLSLLLQPDKSQNYSKSKRHRAMLSSLDAELPKDRLQDYDDTRTALRSLVDNLSASVDHPKGNTLESADSARALEKELMSLLNQNAETVFQRELQEIDDACSALSKEDTTANLLSLLNISDKFAETCHHVLDTPWQPNEPLNNTWWEKPSLDTSKILWEAREDVVRACITILASSSFTAKRSNIEAANQAARVALLKDSLSISVNGEEVPQVTSAVARTLFATVVSAANSYLESEAEKVDQVEELNTLLSAVQDFLDPNGDGDFANDDDAWRKLSTSSLKSRAERFEPAFSLKPGSDVNTAAKALKDVHSHMEGEEGCVLESDHNLGYDANLRQLTSTVKAILSDAVHSKSSRSMG
jgi:hypothetical protein